ncbi:MAG: hypothetical protein J6P20_01745 [Oscillospiraceae bacterium]|nr:hypothetical protein [Oscillospiraceae bacterium]
MKLMIVDGNSILNRAYYGVKPLSNHKGVFTNAIYGFFNILLKAIDDTGAESVAIAFDRREKTFRHKAVASYKANRKGMPEELAMQLPLTQQILEAMGYPVVTCAGWEADDILGTVSAALSAAGENCILLTGDRDNLQLINEHVSVRLATNKEPILYDTARFEADYGFPPKGLIDLKALMGDTSDNIKGVAGIGEKTAMALIQEYGTIEALYEALPDAAGIKPAANGFTAVRIAPQPGGLKWLKATMPTPKGDIVLDLQFKDNAVSGSVTLPDALPGTFVWQEVEHPLRAGVTIIP